MSPIALPSTASGLSDPNVKIVDDISDVTGLTATLSNLLGTVVGAPLVHKVDADGRIHCEANYAVLRTRLSKESTVFNVGRTLDEVVPTPEGLKFASRLVVYDSEMIPNSLIYPI